MFGWIFLSFCGCEETAEDPNQFNAQDESLEVIVGISDIQEETSRTLYSTTGLVEIATASISPGGGPVGTVHQIQVQIFEEYMEDVQEVRIDIDSGERGTQQYTLIPDSAQPSLFVLDLESMGGEEEERGDIFLFSLWDLPEPQANETTDGSSWLP